MTEKPRLSFWQIWNISFGFLGVQIGFALQNGNTSRILQAIGADVHNLGYFWLAAPMAGLVVQPIIGLFSDKVWTRMGRRTPFILLGAIVSASAMFFMPNSERFANIMPAVWFGAMMLLLMDASFNITMQPFRALVSDMLPESQRNKGYAIQSFLINVGAVFGSLLPYILTTLKVANTPEAGAKVAPSVIWSFYIGGGMLLLTVLWTAFTTKEYPPEQFAEYNKSDEPDEQKLSFWEIIGKAPKVMYQLAVVQFFTWFALYMMWVFSTPAIAKNVWQSQDANSKAFNDAGDWVGVLFGAYALVAAIYAALLPSVVNKLGRKNTYMLSLLAGGAGLIGIMFLKDKYTLLLSTIGIGIAWAAVLALPYAILSSKLPPKQTGVFMGLFNASIAVPQIVCGFFAKPILTGLFHDDPVPMLALGGVSMIVAGICAKVLVNDPHGEIPNS